MRERYLEGDCVGVVDERTVRYGIITNHDTGEDEFEIRFSTGTTDRVSATDLLPVPNVDLALSDREYDVLTNIWGSGLSRSLHQLDEYLLWEMRHQVSEAVHACYDDDDMDAMGILFPLEYKITRVLAERSD